jgi:hypothetical protein
VGINTSVILSPDRLQQMEQAVSGQELYMREFKTMPGAYYAFRVPAGLTTTAEAIRRLARFPGVSDAFRENAEPLCFISDIIPLRRAIRGGWQLYGRSRSAIWLVAIACP